MSGRLEPFQRFLSLRERIAAELRDELVEIGRKLPHERLESPKLIMQGRASAYFSIGTVDGIRLAVREFLPTPQTKECDVVARSRAELARADEYIDKYLQYVPTRPKHHAAVQLIGGVQISTPERERYAVLLEDVTLGALPVRLGSKTEVSFGTSHYRFSFPTRDIDAYVANRRPKRLKSSELLHITA